MDDQPPYKKVKNQKMIDSKDSYISISQFSPAIGSSEMSEGQSP